MSLTIIDSEAAKDVAGEMMEEAGVDVRFYTFVSDAFVEDAHLQRALLANGACLG